MGKYKVQTSDGRLWFETNTPASAQPMPDGENAIETPSAIFGLPVEILGKPVVFTNEERRDFRLTIGQWDAYMQHDLVLYDGAGQEVERHGLTHEQVRQLREWLDSYG